jgi:hypothetical protein
MNRYQCFGEICCLSLQGIKIPNVVIKQNFLLVHTVAARLNGFIPHYIVILGKCHCSNHFKLPNILSG